MLDFYHFFNYYLFAKLKKFEKLFILKKVNNCKLKINLNALI